MRVGETVRRDGRTVYFTPCRYNEADVSMKTLLPLFAWLTLGWAISALGQNSDYAREKRWADEGVPALVVGEAVWLQAAQPQKFLGLYTEAKNPRGAIVLAHGIGVHPDHSLIGALRTRLADAGYTTLAIQMPILAAAAPAERYLALFGEAGERLDAAVSYLQGQGYRRIVLVSHSMGSRMANHFIAFRPGVPLAAWVSLSISSGEFEPAGLGRFPLFDIYAQQDFPAVLQGTPGRARLLARIARSRQAMVYGTDHYFARKEKELTGLLVLLLNGQ